MAQQRRKVTKSTAEKTTPPDGATTYFQPVTTEQAEDAARAEHLAMAINGTSNLVVLTEAPGPLEDE